MEDMEEANPLGLMTTRQTAAFLDCSVSQLEKSRVDGDGPQFVKMGKTVRYRRQDLIDFVEQNLRQSTSGSRKGMPGKSTGRPRKRPVEETTEA